MDFEDTLNSLVEEALRSTNPDKTILMVADAVDEENRAKVLRKYHDQKTGTVSTSPPQKSRVTPLVDIAQERDAVSEQVLAAMENATSLKKNALLGNQAAEEQKITATFSEQKAAAERAQLARSAFGLDLSDPANIIVAAQAQYNQGMEQLKNLQKARATQPNVFQTILMGANGLAKRDEVLASQQKEAEAGINLSSRIINSAQTAAINQMNIDKAAAAPSLALAEAAKQKAESDTAFAIANVDMELAKNYAAEAQRVAQQKLSATNMQLLRDQADATREQRAAAVQQVALERGEKATNAALVDSQYRKAASQFRIEIPAGVLVSPQNIAKLVPPGMLPVIQDIVSATPADSTEPTVMGSNVSRAVDNARIAVTRSTREPIPVDITNQTKQFSRLKETAVALLTKSMPTFSSLKTSERDAEISKQMLMLATAQLDNAGSPGSIYSADYLTLLEIGGKKLEQSHPAYKAVTKFQTSPLFKSVKAEYEATKTVDDARVIKIAADLVNAKVLPHAVATKAAAAYFEAAKELNNASMQYARWGLPTQETYVSNLDITSEAGGFRKFGTPTDVFGRPTKYPRYWMPRGEIVEDGSGGIPFRIDEMKFSTRGQDDRLDLSNPAVMSYILVRLESEKVLGDLRGSPSTTINNTQQ